MKCMGDYYALYVILMFIICRVTLTLWTSKMNW